MARKAHPTFFEKADFYALAAMLASIPGPRITKDPKEIGRQRIELAQHIPVDAILHRMSKANPEAERSEQDRILLATALVLLDAIGAIEVTENQTVAAVTESAGHLLHSISYFLRECAAKPGCYRPVRLDPHEEDPGKNPFLILARQAEEHRFAWKGKEIQPIREHKIISVLIKGERRKPAAMNGKEAVILHVWKEGWGEERKGAYALIGSEQISRDSPTDAAYRALKEDLENPPDEEIVQRIELHSSDIEDEVTTEYAWTHGAYTRYIFNLFWVKKIDGELRVEKHLRPRWLTYDEICKQRTTTGEEVITRVKLLQAIDLDQVPVVITDARPFEKPMVEHVNDLLKEIRDVGRPFGALARSVGLMIWSGKWWLILLVGILLSAILLAPIIDTKLPGLTNIAAVLGIIGSIASLIGLAIKLQRSRK